VNPSGPGVFFFGRLLIAALRLDSKMAARGRKQKETLL
jgi:hypothetical protein